MEPFEKRKEKFMEWLSTGYKAKMEELGCDMMSVPLYVPDGQGGFKTVVDTSVVDVSSRPIKSPFQAS